MEWWDGLSPWVHLAAIVVVVAVGVPLNIWVGRAVGRWISRHDEERHAALIADLDRVEAEYESRNE